MYTIFFNLKSKCKDKKDKIKVKINGKTKKVKCQQIEEKGLLCSDESKEGKPLKELCPKKCGSKKELCLNVN